MSVFPQSSFARITLAVLISLLIHALLLFTPMLQLPPSEVPLPPLLAKLEPLPKIAIPQRPAPRKPKPVEPPKPAPTTMVPEEIPVETGDTPAVDISDINSLPAEPEPAVEEVPPPTQAAHPLPKYAQLTFIAYKGTDLAVGEARHRLEISDDQNYTLKISTNTTGLASVFKTFELNQESVGKLTPQGLKPDHYSEAKNIGKGTQALEASFDWQAKVLSFSNGTTATLNDQAQDIISFMYQLSQLSLEQGTLPIQISNGKKLERYELVVGEEETLQTRMGTVRALPLRKVHSSGEEGLEIWLGLEYRLLPVKIRQIDRSGEIAGQMVISEIRVSDN